MNSEQTNEIAAALAKAQGAMENAKFNKVNPHFKNKYADLAAIIDAIKKPLADNGIGYTQTTFMNSPAEGFGGNAFTLVTTLMHASGQWISSEYPLPYAPDKPQVLGSALTYARRYELAAICGIAAEEDDDAEAAAEATRQAYKRPPKPADDIIKAPERHDVGTGEIIEPAEANEPPIPVEDMAREAAMRGAVVMKKFFLSRSAEDQARMKKIKPDLDKLVDEFEKSLDSEGS